MFTNNSGNEHGNEHGNKHSNEHGKASAVNWQSVKLDFTRFGLKQFLRINSRLGTQFIRGSILFYELKCYLAAHEAIGAGGTHITVLDEACQTLRYDDRIVLILRRMQGVWYITDVCTASPATAYAPTFIWMRIKRGVDFILAHVLIGWQRVTGKTAVEQTLAFKEGR